MILRIRKFQKLYSFRIESNTEVTIRFKILNIRTALIFLVCTAYGHGHICYKQC